MIVFDLICIHGHTFEGWFDDSDSFEKQNKQGLIACPVCNDTAIEKKLSTFAIKGGASPYKSSQIPSSTDVARLSEELTEYVDKNFEDVGCQFTREALKIHYGVSEPRNIKGISTEAEEKMLKDEGINYVKVPVLKEKDPKPEEN